MKLAGFLFLLASERDLGLLVAQKTRNLLVYDIAYLVVVVDYFAACIADTPLLIGHQSIAGLVRGADVAVDAGPAVVAFAGVA